MTARATAGAALCALALAGGGCGGVEARAVAFRAPSPAAGRAELYVGKVPARPYYEVGLVQAVGVGAGAAEGPVLQALRTRGQGLGCDAIVRASVELGQTAAHAIGVCVRWASVAATPGAAAPQAPTRAEPPPSEAAPIEAAPAELPAPKTTPGERPAPEAASAKPPATPVAPAK